MTKLQCPSCDNEGKYVMEEQHKCTTYTCRVTTYQITIPPDRHYENGIR